MKAEPRSKSLKREYRVKEFLERGGELRVRWPNAKVALKRKREREKEIKREAENIERERES